MKTVYELTEHGWKRVFTAKSFKHACSICARLQQDYPQKQFCVNS